MGLFGATKTAFPALVRYYESIGDGLLEDIKWNYLWLKKISRTLSQNYVLNFFRCINMKYIHIGQVFIPESQ